MSISALQRIKPCVNDSAHAPLCVKQLKFSWKCDLINETPEDNVPVYMSTWHLVQCFSTSLK